MARSYKKCPNCNSTNVVPIMYGYPGPEAVADSDKGRVHLGGCIVDIMQPDLYCKDCDCKWQRTY